MEKGLLAFVLLAALFAAFSAPIFACTPGYEENFKVQVLDAMGRPIQGAEVYATYQIDLTSGKGYTNTSVKKTDGDGMVSFIFQNAEILQDRVDCYFNVYVKYDLSRNSSRVEAQMHPNTLTYALPVYRLDVRTVDQNGNILRNATVRVREVSAQTDSAGLAAMEVTSGFANLSMRYENGVFTRNLTVRNDTLYKFQLNMYNLFIHVLDDTDNRLEADVSINGLLFKTGNDGSLSLPRMTIERPKITTYFKGIDKSIQASLAAQSEYYFVYDFHSPTISQINASIEKNQVVVDLEAFDPGLRASGISQNGLTLKYSTSDGSENTAIIDSKDGRNFRAYLDAIDTDKDGVVRISIEARDSDGNSRRIEGAFTIEHIIERNDTVQNQTGGTVNPPASGFEITPIHILLIAVGIGVVIVAIKFINERAYEE
jgi:hypothetical protein